VIDISSISISIAIVTVTAIVIVILLLRYKVSKAQEGTISISIVISSSISSDSDFLTKQILLHTLHPHTTASHHISISVSSSRGRRDSVVLSEVEGVGSSAVSVWSVCCLCLCCYNWCCCDLIGTIRRTGCGWSGVVHHSQGLTLW